MTQSPLPALIGINLTPDQQALLDAPRNSSLILSGPAGSGKSTAAAHRMLQLINDGVDAESILVLVPQRSLGNPYQSAIQIPGFPPGGRPSILTMGGLAQRMITLFWPLIAGKAGFKKPKSEPRFLTVETAQYFLSTILEPLLSKGFFQSITIDPNRLNSQILDNLNKSAVVGFPPDKIAQRLTAAWAGKTPQRTIYAEAQECALLFRELCHKNNLLDFSLQVSVFMDHLWPSLICREFLHKSFSHLIYDNIEEDYPVAHDLIQNWLPAFNSALLIRDTDAGFRSFLGADPVSAVKLGEHCSLQLSFKGSMIKTPPLDEFENTISESITQHKLSRPVNSEIKNAFSVRSFRFYVESMAWVSQEIQRLIKDDLEQPREIAILTPFLSDSLRFSFSNFLTTADIPIVSHHPYRSLNEEPTVKTMLTFAKLANPDWQLKPGREDVRNSFMQALGDCDLVRADLLSQILFKPSREASPLNPFAGVNLEMQERITFLLGQRYEDLRQWLAANPVLDDNLDHWLSRLFGELLSQPAFGFHTDFLSASVITRLIDSFRKFKNISQVSDKISSSTTCKEYIRVLERGVLPAQSLSAWKEQREENAVMLTPAFTYLVNNQPVKYQFWMDIGSQGWWSRLDQPLTQPFVLSRNWEEGKRWTDQEDYASNQRTLNRLVTGLLRRCSQHVYMCSIGINEQGLEEKGALMLAVQTILRELNLAGVKEHV